MDALELLPDRLHLLRAGHANAYLWTAPDGALTLVDAGPPGCGEEVADAVRGLGRDPGRLRLLVLTHGHEDHAGGASGLAGPRPGLTVAAPRLDAPVVRGERPYDPPVLRDWEVPIRAAAPDQRESYEPVRVDRELADGDVLDLGGGDTARVVAAPGHTPGSIALFVPGHGVLFTGDVAANVGGRTLPGVFHTDHRLALESYLALARLDPEVACVGHGEPIVGGAGAVLRDAVA